jgi:hypothetical protein
MKSGSALPKALKFNGYSGAADNVLMVMRDIARSYKASRGTIAA